MKNMPPDFEVCIKGHSLLVVEGGQVDVSGFDKSTDLLNIARLIGILSSVLDSGLAGQSVSQAARPGKASPALQTASAAPRTGNVWYLDNYARRNAPSH